MSYMFVKHSHLPATYTGANVAQTIVVANLFVLIVRKGFARLSREKHHALLCRSVGANKCTAAGGSNHLVAIKTQYAKAAKRPDNLTFIARAQAFGSVFQDRNVVFRSHVHNLADLGRHTIKIYDDDSFGLPAGLRNTILYGTIQQFRIHIPSIPLRVNKDRNSA